MLFTLTPSAPADGYGEALLPVAALRKWIEADQDEDTDLLAALRDVGINAVEQYANLRMGPCTGMVATFDHFGPRMRVGIGPAATLIVTAIEYLDSSGAPVTIAPGGWRLGVDGNIMPPLHARWPHCASSVSVAFDVGFPAGRCPPGLITAAKMFAAHLFANREAVVTSNTSVSSTELPLGFQMLCDQHRTPVI